MLNILDNDRLKKTDRYAATCSNLSVILMKLNRGKELVLKFAKEGLNVASQVYSRGSKEVRINN